MAPNPAARDLLQRVRRIEISTRRAVEDTLSGQYHSVFKGRGMDFSEVRPYAAGDEVRSIDWNVTARTGHLHVKRFVEERELTVMILCDVSASSDFGSGQRTKAEVAAEIAALVAFSAVSNGDRVGLVLFTDRIERFVPPRKGRRHALRIVSEILQARPESRGTSVGAALEFLRKAMRRRTVAFLLSDFLQPDGKARQPAPPVSPLAPPAAPPDFLDGRAEKPAPPIPPLARDQNPGRSPAPHPGPAGGPGQPHPAAPPLATRFPFERQLRVAVRKHDVVPIRLCDRLETELPAAGLAWIEDPESGRVIRVDLSDPGVRARIREGAKADDDELRKLFARLKLDGARVQADDADYVTPLLAFFRARARRLA